MAEPTYTRAAIRREIGRQLEMPFFQKFTTTSTVDSNTTASKIIDASMTGPTGYFKNAWLYMVDGDEAGEMSRIVHFSEPENAFILQTPLTGIPTAGEQYEIYNRFSPIQIHNAINRAIEGDAFPSFFDHVTDESLVMQEDTLRYDISGLSSVPYMVRKLWLERNYSIVRGTASSSSNNTLVDAGVTFPTVGTDWRISIYDGTGKGQLRTVASGSGDTITVSAVWDTNPDSTSKYALWDSTEHRIDWHKLHAARFSSKLWPSTMYFTRRYFSLYGMRIRLEYIAKPSALATDAATTMVPQDFIIAKALHYLWAAKRPDNRVDRQLARQEASDYWEEAERYKQQMAFLIPDGTIWLDGDDSNYSGVDLSDPLGWEFEG